MLTPYVDMNTSTMKISIKPSEHSSKPLTMTLDTIQLGGG